MFIVKTSNTSRRNGSADIRGTVVEFNDKCEAEFETEEEAREVMANDPSLFAPTDVVEEPEVKKEEGEVVVPEPEEDKGPFASFSVQELKDIAIAQEYPIEEWKHFKGKKTLSTYLQSKLD